MVSFYQLVIEDDPDPLDMALLEERLADAAVTAAGVGDEREFGIFVRGGDGRILAGVCGSTWGGCCQVHALWVDESLRGVGLARHLMATAETAARQRGCRVVMGLTYDVLTGDFYDRLGYRTIGLMENFPAGTSTRWYRKDL